MSKDNASIDSAGKDGFTLLEVLVVIAVISVLMALSLPAFDKCKSVARRTVCTSNQLQLYVGWTNHWNGCDGRFMKRVNDNVTFGGWEGSNKWLPRPLNPCLDLSDNLTSPQNAKVFRCPADNGGIPGYGDEKAFDVMGNSYQANLVLVGYPELPVLDNPYKDLHKAINAIIPDIRKDDIDASNVILQGDWGWVNLWRTGERIRHDWHDKPDHDNILFVDGSVKMVHIHKGIYHDSHYTVLPKRELIPLATEAQNTSP